MSEERPAGESPAAFRDLFTNREYRAVYAATVLSWVGDYLARAAVTAMVYQHTHSALLSAAAFAIGYLPWLLGGPVLAALAERYPYRRVMIVADLLRAPLIALAALPGLPLPVLLALLLGVALVGPPFEAARSALLPRILSGDRYVLAISLNGATMQAAIVAGYLAGGVLAGFHPRAALLLDAATFLASAALIAAWVRSRPAVTEATERRGLVRETAAGFRVVAGNPVLRSIALVVFAAMLMAVVPEGLAAAWAGHLSEDPHRSGLLQGLIMVGTAVGSTVGGLAINRLVPAATRARLIRPFALLVPLSLVPALVDPPAAVVVALSCVTGVAVAGMLPATNGMFVQALPDAFRARAFGLMNTGVQLMQGMAVLGTGLLAREILLPRAVGLWGLAGVAIMTLACLTWPSAETRERARQLAAATGQPAQRSGGEPSAATAPADSGAGRSPGTDSPGTDGADGADGAGGAGGADADGSGVPADTGGRRVGVLS